MEFSIKSKKDGTKDLYLDDKFIQNGTQEELFALLQAMVDKLMEEKNLKSEEK